MSRGPGRVMRAVLETLEGGALDTGLLALHVGASEESTRRACRSLRQAGRVRCLGFAAAGRLVYALPQVAAPEDLWSAERQAKVSELLGPRFVASLRRLLVSAL